MRIVESMEFGKKSLRNHLLLMVNLAINSYYNKWLVVKNRKIRLEKRISASVNESEEHTSAKDAEMHHSLSMSKTNIPRKPIQFDDRKCTINKEKLTKKKSVEYYPYSSSSPASR